MTVRREDYIRAAQGPRDRHLDEILRSSLLDHQMPTIQIDDNTGRALQLLTKLRSPNRVIELGTLFGYSAVYLARGLPAGGRLTTVERDPIAAQRARENIEKVGLSDRVEIVTCDAATYLKSVLPSSVGLIFIDAEKNSYVEYLKLCLPLLEPNGLLIADDVFGSGDYSREKGALERDGAVVTSIRAYVWAVCRNERLISFFLGSENGLLVSMRK